MDKLILSHDRSVPRYTSYPTAPHFHDKYQTTDFETELKSLPEDEAISLYLHIPFCQKMCWYCGCFTKVARRYAPIENYLHLLMREAQMVSERIGRKQKISHIHFGGGSPTMLRCEDFSLLMDKLRSSFDILPDAEIAIEVDPRGVTEARVAAYAKSGVNRVSFGVQDMNDDVQQAINRVQPFNVVYDAIKLFRDYNITTVNLDLIYGLPKQTEEGMWRTVELSLLFKPERISLFGYAHVPWMKKHMRLINESDLPNKEQRLKLAKLAEEKLLTAGYSSIGIDHFIKPDDQMAVALAQGKLRRNFQGYTTDNADILIGLGASSISALPNGYAQNTSNMDDYKQAIIGDKLPIIKGITITKQDKLRREIINCLMCFFSVDLSEICSSYDTNWQEIYNSALPTLQPLINDKILTEKNGILTISQTTKQLVRIACSAFDNYLESSTTKHSSAV